MALSNDLISQFVKVTQGDKKSNKETIAYGTVAQIDRADPNDEMSEITQVWVKLDGANELTPLSRTTDVSIDDRVIVMIKNHSAVITGNITSPSARTEYVKVVEQRVVESGNKVTELDTLLAEKVSTKDLYTELLNTEEFTADKADINQLKADVADVKELNVEALTVDVAELNKVIADKIDASKVESTYAKISDLDTTNLSVTTLSGDYATFKNATTDTLDANDASIKALQTGKLSTESADARYANIDFSNIGEAAIKKIFSDTGLIKDLTVGTGTITGKLVGVTISGDLIEGNTVKADKLVVKGSDGLYYKLNIDAGATTSTEVTETDLQNGLHGTAIIAKTITAEKISVSDLVAFGADIGGFKIKSNAIHSSAKSSVSNTTRGIYFDNDGQLNVGDSNNFIKYYRDASGNYKLEISAVNNLTVGSRNLLLNTGGNGFPVLSGGAELTRSSGVKNISSVDGVLTMVCDAVQSGENASELYYRFMAPAYSTNVLYCLKAGESYTLSGKAKVVTTSGTLTRLTARTQNNIAGAGWSQDTITTITEVDSNEWVYFKSTFLIDPAATGCYTSIQLYFDTEWAGTIQLTELKLQRGTKDTGWSPAPEDLLLSEQAERVYATKASLSIESDRITSSVESITKLQNEKIGATNLLLNSGRFPSDNPIILSSERNDGYVLYFNEGVFLYTPRSIAPSAKLVLQACTDAKWGDYHGYDEETQKEVVNMWLYWYDNLTDASNGTNNYVRAQVYYGDGLTTGQYVWKITAPESTHTVTGEWYVCLRLNTYSDGTEVVTHKVWNVQLEDGDRATTWAPCPDDMATNKSLSETNENITAAEERISVSESLIQQLSNSISMLVTDGNGTSLMTQTEDGWTFSTADIQASVNNVSESLNALEEEVGSVNGTVDVLQQAVDDLGLIAEYVNISTYEDEPCIELGEGDSEFKLRITNTRMIFTEGSTILAYFNNQSLHIKKAVVEEELQQGGFVWKARSNGNLGLVWKGGNS